MVQVKEMEWNGEGEPFTEDDWKTWTGVEINVWIVRREGQRQEKWDGMDEGEAGKGEKGRNKKRAL